MAGSLSPYGGYKRIQISGDTAANFEKYNPSCRPRELIAVIKPNGHICIKMNRTTEDQLYNELPILWDEDVAAKLESDLSDSQAAATAAQQSAASAKSYSDNAATALNEINAKEVAIMQCEGFQLVLNADGSVKAVTADSEDSST